MTKFFNANNQGEYLIMTQIVSPDADPGALLFQAVAWENAELLSDLLNGDALACINQPKYDDDNDNGNTVLHLAAQARNPDLALILLNAKADPNVQNAAAIGRETPLHIAARAGRQEVVAALLSAGASVAALSVRRQRPIDVASTDGCWQLLHAYEDFWHEKLVKLRQKLFSCYAQNNVQEIEELCRNNQHDIAEVVDNCLVATNQNSGGGDIPIVCHAAAHNKDTALKLLLRYGASTRPSSNNNRPHRSALFYAVERNALESISTLLDHEPTLAAIVAENDGTRELPIHTAVKNAACIDAVKRLLNHKYPSDSLRPYDVGSYELLLPFDFNHLDSTDATPLFVACSSKNTKAVQALLGYRAPAAKRVRDSPSSRSATPLSRSNYQTSNNTPVSPDQAPAANNTEQAWLCPVTIDLRCGADGRTALFEAVRTDSFDIAKLLLERKANPNLTTTSTTDDVGATVQCFDCLGIAVQNGACDLASLLLQYKAMDLSRTAISVAVRDFDAVRHSAAAGVAASSQKADDKNADDDARTKKFHLFVQILAVHAQRDADFKINKLAMETLHGGGAGAGAASPIASATAKPGGGGGFTYGSMFPSTPVAVDWQNIPTLSSNNNTNSTLRELLVHSALSLNDRLQQTTCALYAITRLNVSYCAALRGELPAFLFESLRSLRILNASHSAFHK